MYSIKTCNTYTSINCDQPIKTSGHADCIPPVLQIDGRSDESRTNLPDAFRQLLIYVNTIDGGFLFGGLNFTGGHISTVTHAHLTTGNASLLSGMVV